MNTLSQERLKEIEFDYLNNENSYVRKKYNCRDLTLRNFLTLHNIERKKKPQYTKNENFFENIDSEEKAYFLGFICADGSIINNRNKLSFCINTKDIDILLKLKELLETTAPVGQSIYTDKRNGTIINTCGIQIYSKKIINDLSMLGINENKSNSLRMPVIKEEFNKDFIRGLFDGDGYIRNKCSLISTLECLDDIINYLKNFDIDINISDRRFALQKEKNVYRIDISGDNKFKLLTLLYNNSNIHLERKYLSYLNAIEFYNNQIVKHKSTISILLKKDNLIFDSMKDYANYLNMNYSHFITKLNNGFYNDICVKYEKVITKIKRNSEIIVIRKLL